MAKKSKQVGPNFKPGTIWTGDNLTVMRGVNSESVDLIYLDPPFNSNRNYEAPVGSEAAGAYFKDAWTLDDIDLHEHGELADRNPAAYKIIDAAGETHSKGMKSYLIFMAVRIIEMHRVLKPTGSIYLHCDPTASHYLKLLMDSVFGRKNFQADITWKRSHSHNDKMFGSISDCLLYYSKSDVKTQNVKDVIVPFSDEENKKKYSKIDERGRYTHGDLTGAGVSQGKSSEPWNGFDPSSIGRHWSAPKSGEYAQYLHTVLLPGYLDLKEIHERLDALQSADMISWSKNGKPSLKRYLTPGLGLVPGNIWADISMLSPTSKERMGYPTQKPVALLERIIKASSNPGDIVLDPFCGCATTLVAATKLGRQYLGIDVSPLAARLVENRLSEYDGKVISLDSPPKRTDVVALPNYRTHAHRLYGVQEGVCKGCDVHFPFRVMDVDHILPRAKGGTDHEENLQLLCSGCNRSKGKKTMAEWRTGMIKHKN